MLSSMRRRLNAPEDLIHILCRRALTEARLASLLTQAKSAQTLADVQAYIFAASYTDPPSFVRYMLPP